MIQRTVALILSMLMSTQSVAPARIENVDKFLLTHSVELVERMKKLAASEAYIELAGSSIPNQEEILPIITSGEFSAPDRMIVLSVDDTFAEPLASHLLEVDAELFGDPDVLEGMRRRALMMMPGILVSSSSEIGWYVANTVLNASGADDLPEELTSDTYVLLIYDAQQLMSITTFIRFPRWNYVSYSTNVMPCGDLDIANWNTKDIYGLFAEMEAEGMIDAAGLTLVEYDAAAIKAMLERE